MTKLTPAEAKALAAYKRRAARHKVDVEARPFNTPTAQHNAIARDELAHHREGKARR